MIRKTIPYAILAVMIFAGVFCIHPMRVYADINGNESRVIAAAGQQFYYGGEYYQATESALNELYSRLDEPDTDLSGSQADEAIDKMYANIGTGVSEGYLEKVGGTTPAPTPTPTPTPAPGTTPTPTPTPGTTNPGTGTTNPGTGTTNPGTGTTNPGTGTTNPGTGTTNPGTGTTPTPAQGTTNPGTGTTPKSGTATPGTGMTNPGTGTTPKSGTTTPGTGMVNPETGLPLTAREIVSAAPGMSSERQALLDRLTGLTQGQREAIVSDYNDKHEDEILKAGSEKLKMEARLATGSEAIQENGNTGIWNALSESEWYEGIKSDLLNTRPEQGSAKKSVIYDVAENTLTVNDGEGEGGVISLSQFFPYQNIRLFLIISGIIAFVAAGLGLGMSFLSDSRRMGHHERRRMKKRAGVAISVASGLNLFVFAVSAGVGAGLVSSSNIMEMINTSGFHQYAYEGMYAKAQQILLLADYDKDVLEEPLSFSRFQFLSKQDTMDVINGKTVAADLSTLKSEIINALASEGEHGEVVNSAIADEVMKAYQKALAGDEIRFIKEVKDSLKMTVIITFLLSILGLLACVVCILRDEGYMGRNLRQAGIAACIAAAACLAGYFITSAGSYEGKAYISPEYLYIFMVQVMGRLKNLWLVCTALGAAFGAALIFGSFRLKGDA